MKSKEEIEQLAQEVHYESKNQGLNADGCFNQYQGFIKGYTQCQKDMAKLTFVPGLSKETLDELFDLHDEDDFIHEDSDKWFEYPKNTPPIHSENYLVMAGGCFEVDLFRGDHNKFNSELYNKNCTITHWMALPNKPRIK